jgi:hypothetical protein
MVSSRKQNGSEITSLNYFSEIGRPELGACRSSLSEARSKISWEVFEYLLDELNRASNPATWKGHRVRACDGTHITLPATAPILEHFPRRECEQSRTHYPKALLVVATDILTGIPSTARLGQGEYGSERELLASMLDDFEPGDIMLMDRGYEGINHLYELEKRGQKFITRLRAAGGSCSKAVRALLASGKTSLLIDFETSRGETYTVRLLLKGMDINGLPIVLCTNLIDRQKYSVKEIYKLYLRRWEIETMYSRVKQLFSMEKFYARSLNGVLQEVWGNLFLLGLTSFAVTASQASSLVSAPNFKNASEVVRRHIHYAISIRLTRRRALRRARAMIEQIGSLTCRKQTGRKNPRISKQPATKWNVHRPLAKNRPNQPYKKAKMRA